MIEPPAVNPFSTALFAALVTIALAIIAGIQLLAVTWIQSRIQSQKEARDVEAKSREKKEDAELKRREKEEDYARQDVVAEKVEQAARRAEGVARNAADAATRLEKAQAETIARTDEVARVAAEADLRVQDQLKAIDSQAKKIHTLVNSDMTAARTSERVATAALLVSLRQIQTLKLKMGLSISTEETEAIDRTEKQIRQLDQILADRLAAQKEVDSETELEIQKGDV